MLCDPFNLLIFFFFFRFLGSNLRILPVHNAANAVNLMCTIAKVSPLRRMAYIHTHCQTFKVPDFKCTLSSVGLTNTLLLSPSEKLLFPHAALPQAETQLLKSSHFISSSSYQDHSFWARRAFSHGDIVLALLVP